MEAKQRNPYIAPFLLMAIVLVADQVLKIWVKTHFYIGEERSLIGNWCLLHFVENEGMAFGFKFGGDIGKLLLTIIRLVASGVIFWIVLRLIKKNSRPLLIYSMSLIFVGAIGNLVDSCFYGLVFEESYYNIAHIFPQNGGYAPLFHGKVVDMFYFPLIDTTWPEWVPFVGGNRFEFFSAIFNIADAAITIGVVLLFIEELFCSNKKSTPAVSGADDPQNQEKAVAAEQ